MDYETSNINESERNESRQIDTYLKLLDHSVSCQDAHCSLPKCDSMKRVKMHASTCQRHKRVQCDFCRQFLGLCIQHAKRCIIDQCQVPFCFKLKIKLASLNESKRNESVDSTQDASMQTFRQINDAQEMASIERMLSNFVF